MQRQERRGRWEPFRLYRMQPVWSGCAKAQRELPDTEALRCALRNQGGTATDLAPVMGRGFIFVGADAHIGPAERTVFSVIFGEFVTSQWADVGIGPYRASANSYCFANFERKAFLPQMLNHNYFQIRCTVTGGAYHSVRRVSMCVRNTRKSGFT